jgi:hypothetical protein
MLDGAGTLDGGGTFETESAAPRHAAITPIEVVNAALVHREVMVAIVHRR